MNSLVALLIINREVFILSILQRWVFLFEISMLTFSRETKINCYFELLQV